ncbi:MAG: hypothetical protein IIB00_11270, partial [candidate division Zixibacteria bacterium]|nr:hypothetical protein [candidate division Zixibacteria bacterium]
HSDIAWWAWVPILGWFQLVKLAGKPGIWFLFFLVPFVNVFVMAYLWMEVAKARGSSAFMGFLCILPVIQFISLGILAFGGSGGPDRVAPGQFEGNRAPDHVGHDTH